MWSFVSGFSAAGRVFLSFVTQIRVYWTRLVYPVKKRPQIRMARLPRQSHCVSPDRWVVPTEAWSPRQTLG